MSTGCQNVSQTGRKIYGAPVRQTTERQNDSMADSRAAKEPSLVSIEFVANHALLMALNLL